MKTVLLLLLKETKALSKIEIFTSFPYPMFCPSFSTFQRHQNNVNFFFRFEVPLLSKFLATPVIYLMYLQGNREDFCGFKGFEDLGLVR